MQCKSIKVAFASLLLLGSLPFLSSAQTGQQEPGFVFTPGRNIFPVNCQTINGEIDGNDRVVTENNINWTYDSYPLKIVPGTVVFVEIKTPDTATISLAREYRDSNGGYQFVSLLTRSAIDSGESEQVHNLFVKRTTYGKYTMKITTARAGSGISREQISRVASDWELLDVRRREWNLIKEMAEQFPTAGIPLPPYPTAIDINELCPSTGG